MHMLATEFLGANWEEAETPAEVSICRASDRAEEPEQRYSRCRRGKEQRKRRRRSRIGKALPPRTPPISTHRLHIITSSSLSSVTPSPEGSRVRREAVVWQQGGRRGIVESSECRVGERNMPPYRSSCKASTATVAGRHSETASRIEGSA